MTQDKTLTITVAASDQEDGALVTANVVLLLRGLGVQPGIVSDDVQKVLRLGYDQWTAGQELSRALASAKRVDVVEQRRPPAKLTPEQDALLAEVATRLAESDINSEAAEELALKLVALREQLRA